MKVSFGAMIYANDGQRITPKQDFVKNEIEKIFDTDEVYASDFDGDVTLSDYIKENTFADVFVKSRKDGNITLKLVKDDYFCYQDSMENAPVPKDEKNKSLETNIDLTKPLRSIKKRIRDFAKRCEKYADTYESRSIENAETDFEKIKKQDEALALISEEEDFVREFGTDDYN